MPGRSAQLPGHRGHQNVAAIAADIDLLQPAAAQLAGDALAQAEHGGRHGGDTVFFHIRRQAEAMIRPSTETTAEASISGEALCISRKRATISSVRERVTVVMFIPGDLNLTALSLP